ncbi:hypothetical protein [Duganella sp. HH105]|uniref:hypothetical protein n=1 Tax=Duganella sp. HH105 TaxID=1781067 RepID=UPI000877B4EC|nr:hypothetical protein [Duganella sp. HH105]OEZ63166.1 hypothetical protein DUGA6_09620 [Duganella sp. HH105]
MVATMSVIVSPSTLFALMERLRETGAAIDPAEAVDAAIQHWLVTTCTAQPAAPRGYPGAPLPAAVAMPSDPSTAPAPSVPRNVTPGQGWTEPERRKFRFRLEDVAFD